MKELTEKRSIDTITTEILFYKQQAGVTILEIGKRLIEAKEQLEHGEWLDWLANSVSFNERAAQRFMQLATEYSNTSTLTDLGYSKALALLAVPAEQREEFAAEVRAEDISVRELKKKIREAESSAAGWKRQAEQAKIEAERRRVELRELSEKEHAHAEELEAMAQDRVKLTQRVQELENRPVEVATMDATEEQLREAEQRGMEHNKWELDVAKRQLGEQVAKTNRLQQRLDEKQQELKRLKEDAAEASDDTRINQTLGEINAWARELQEAHRRITELLGNLDDLSRTRVQELRRKLLRRMLEEIK